MTMRLIVFFLLGLASPVLAQQAAEPTETTEKFGAWTVRCVVQQAEGATKACEVFLAVQGQGGLIAQIALGKPQEGGTLMVARTPLGVLVSEPVSVSAAGAEVAPIALAFATCLASGCIAQAVIAGGPLGGLVGQETAAVGFAERSGRKLQINIPLDGLKDALSRIGIECGSDSCVRAE